jgi:3-methylfumaryl-CoA hydratase
MWAGGRVSFVQPLLIGSAVRKESSILSVDHKRGRSGDLVFVTVLHQVKSLAGELLIREEHDIVYKGATSAPQQAENPASAHHGPPAKAFTPTSTTLFRYSALTFNGHRIHYDTDYCRAIEGYRNLVIHGPLTATMLAMLAEEVSGHVVREFSYRSMVPAILGDSLGLHADSVRNLVSLSASLGNGATCMQAEARTA